MNQNTIHTTKESGQSLTEMAISFIFLALLLAGIAELGRAFYTFISLRDAAQEGALYGSIDPENDAEIIARACAASNFLQNLTCDEAGSGADIEITINMIGVEVGKTPCMGNGVELFVTYEEFPVLMPFAGIFSSNQSIPIRARVTNTILTPACTGGP